MWTHKGTLYQIYPIGFCGAPRTNDGLLQNRIRKVIDWLDYIQSLGVNGILFNPLLESDTHGYDTRDFSNLDTRLGTNDDLKEVISQAHKRGLNIIFDGVFNHVGRGFWAFQDVKEKGFDSSYKEWFNISFDGNSPYDDGFWYEGWEGHYELVKLNLRNPEVVDYLLESVKLWIEDFGIDGIRLDVAYSLDRDFMKKLRVFTKGLKTDFTLIGEMFFGDYNQLVNDEMLDSCTNYECYKGLHSSFNSMNLFEIAHSLHRQFGNDPWCIYREKHLMSFVDNHDVARISSMLNNPKHLQPIYGLLFGMPGIPCIYYGSEWGAEGPKIQGNDDNLRPSFNQPIHNELSKFITCLISLRSQNEALCYGDFANILITNRQLIFKRQSSSQTIFVCINADESDYTAFSDALNGHFKDLITGDTINLEGSLKLEKYDVKYLLKE